MPNIDSNKCILFISNASEAGSAGLLQVRKKPRAYPGPEEPRQQRTASLEGKDHPLSAQGFNASPVPQDCSCLSINNIQRLNIPRAPQYG